MENKSVREILDTYGKYTSMTAGRSMWPLLHEHKDNIIVIKPEGRLKKYDVALYESPDKKYIMHRVVEVHDDHYIITGDNLLAKEYVTDDMVCGVLAGFYKNGKHYIDCQKSKLYMAYSKIWVALRPVRPAILFAERAFGFIKRKIFRSK